MPDSLRRFKADIFQALAHPTRIAIIELLENGEMSAGELIEKLGMEQANISQHLAVLRAKQLVVNRPWKCLARWKLLRRQVSEIRGQEFCGWRFVAWMARRLTHFSWSKTE